MNYTIILYMLGKVMMVESVLMLMPTITAFIYNEKNGIYFLLCGGIGFTLGYFISCKKPKNNSFYAREGFATVALSWIVLSILGALPFVLSREIPSFTDALFETISGFTTTGASILPDVEKLSYCMLFWRSFTHWIGGMGVLVFMLAILPLAGGGQSMHIMRAESPGPSVGKLVPKIQKTALYLYIIYFAMTIIEILLLIAGKMPIFHAICLSLGSAGTGGFGILADSVVSYTPYQQNVITIFMFLFGVNFSFYFLILIKHFRDAFGLEEVKWYIIIYLVAVILITLNLTSISGNVFYNLHHAAFQVSSIMTTTGYSTVDFNLWPGFSKTILVVIMFVGACAGSTGGGMKVSRFIIYMKTVKKELSYLIHPRSIKKLKMDGKPIEHEVVRSANIFLIAYILIFTFSVIFISLDEFDLITNFTAVAATINNIGPGLELVGPMGNFSMFSHFSKYVLMFDMLAGRLEIFPMLLVFSPYTWKSN